MNTGSREKWDAHFSQLPFLWKQRMDSTVMEGEPHRSQHHGTMIICYTVFNYVCLQSFLDNTHNIY